MSLMTMTNPNEMLEVLLFMCSKMGTELKFMCSKMGTELKWDCPLILCSLTRENNMHNKIPLVCCETS